MKECHKCHRKLDEENFCKDNRSKDGLYAYCKKCSWKTVKEWRDNNKQKISESRKKYYLKNKETLNNKSKERKIGDSEKYTLLRKKWSRKYRVQSYGITLDIFQEILESQNSKCVICKKDITEKTANIDHDHITGKVRGLLCNKCNVSLGHLEKTFYNEGLLDNAITYLGNSKKWEIEDPR